MKHLILLKILLENNRIDDTYKNIAKLYKVGNSDIKKAKDIYKNEKFISIEKVDKMIKDKMGVIEND